MKGMPSDAVISFSWPATSICSCSDSTTQGPAIRKNGLCRPTSNPQSFILSGHHFQRRLGGLALHLVLAGSLDEGVEERMAVPRRGLELGVELHAHEPRVHVLRQLDDLGQVLALRERGGGGAGI